MAALGEKVFARLTTFAQTQALIGNRCYPDALPQEPNLPAVVYEELPGDTSNGNGLIVTSRVRVTSWAETKAVAVQVSRAVQAGLRQYQERASLPHLIGLMDDDNFGGYDPDTLLSWVTVEFTATLVE
jgi:hypothetical protein